MRRKNGSAGYQHGDWLPFLVHRPCSQFYKPGSFKKPANFLMDPDPGGKNKQQQ